MHKFLMTCCLCSFGFFAHAQTLSDLISRFIELDNEGNYAAAAPVLEQLVVTTDKEYGRSIMYFNALRYAHDNYVKLRNYAKAAEFGERLDTMYAARQPYSDDGLINLNEVFSNFTYAGQYGKAQLYAEKCLVEYEKRFGQGSTDYAACLSNVGISYQAMGLHEKSLEYFSRALAIVEKTEPHSVQHFTILNNVMTGELLSGRKQEATARALVVLNLAKKMYKDKPMVIAHFYGNYAMHLEQIGDRETAAIQYAEAQRLFEKSQLTDNVTYADFLTNYSVFLFEGGRLAEAKESSEGALKIYSAHYGPDHHRTFFAKINGGVYNGLLGDGYSGIRQSTAALEQFLMQFKSNQFVLTEKERIESRKSYDQYFGMLVEQLVTKKVIMADGDKARFNGDLFNLHINSKGMVLSGINKIKNQILQSGDDDLVGLYHEWIQLKNQISYYSGLTRESLLEGGVNLEVMQANASAKEKSLFTRAGLAGQTETNWVTWQQVQDKLKPGELVVEIVRAQSNVSVAYVAFLLSKETTNGPMLVPLADTKMLEGQGYKFYKNSIEYEIADQNSYDLYWKTIAEAIRQLQPANRRVILSMEGIYNLVSLNALRVPTSGKFLLEESNLTLVTNSINLVVKERLPSGADTWLIGDPDFAAPPAPGNMRGAEVRLVSNLRFELTKLPGTYDEVTSIHKLLPAGQTTHIITGKAANETTVKQIRSPRVLHIATHGYFGQDDQAMLNTGIALSGLNSFYENPAAYNGDDGLLTSYEIQDMSLKGTDLVVLSACETGLGNAVTGEGVFGLQRAFRIAGAETLIMSLWKVNDRATQLLMTRFYENQRTTTDLNEAFRQAQRQLMAEYPHPKYWGAFLLVE